MEYYYGALYNWFAVDTGKLAPAGWRVPSDTDWNTLIAYLGGLLTFGDWYWTVAGDKMKVPGYVYWNSPNAGTNESGYSGLGGGYRPAYGSFASKKVHGYGWSSTARDGEYAWYYRTEWGADTVSKLYNNKTAGFGVRLMTDVNPNAAYIQDYDGNWYEVVQIGTQWWLTRDFRCLHYSDGVAIPYAPDFNDWNIRSTGAYCWYNNVAPENMPAPPMPVPRHYSPLRSILPVGF